MLDAVSYRRACFGVGRVAYPHRMAPHSSLVSMLRESLPEYVAVARMAVETTKPGRTASSFYGYPAAALLFAVVDSIGSYYRDDAAIAAVIAAPRRALSTISTVEPHRTQVEHWAA
jgi:hypothetical protein